MANSFQKLADILNIETARLSGDPKRLQLASQMQEQKELKQATAQSEAEINKAIDESNLPPETKRLLKAMPLVSKTKVLVEAQTQKPAKDPSVSDYIAGIMKKVYEDPNYKLTPQDFKLLQIKRTSDALGMELEDMSYEQYLKSMGDEEQKQGTNGIQQFSSTADAIAAGLKSGDQFKTTDGRILTIQ